MEGLVKRGHHTGGRCFGYRSRRVADGVVLEVDETQAEIVLRLFTLYPCGWSLKRIAKTFNSEGILPPQAQKGRVGRSWCRTAIRQILKNPRYNGRLVWNKSKKVRDPRTGRRVKHTRPQSEWLTADAPHLRVISDELFKAVQKRFQQVNDKYGRRSGRRGLSNGLRGSGYLFSGFLKCSTCGANLVLVSGRGRRGYDRYGCPQHFNRGTCKNDVSIHRDLLEDQLLHGLQSQLLSTKVVDEIVKALADTLREEQSSLCRKEEALRRKRSTLEGELRNLIAAIANGFDNESVRAAIVEGEKEVEDIDLKITKTEAISTAPDLNKVRAFALSKLAHLRNLLGKPDNVPEFRNMLEAVVGTIQMQPTENKGSVCYLAKGVLDFITREEQYGLVGAAGRS